MATYLGYFPPQSGLSRYISRVVSSQVKTRRDRTDPDSQTTSLWRRIRTYELADLDDLVRLLDICPDVAGHVKELSFHTEWNCAVHGWQWWKPKICSDATEWIYADQTECAKVYGKRYWDVERLGRPYAGDDAEPDWFTPYDGPEGEGTMATQPDIYATLGIIERIVQAVAPMNQLQSFGWQTWYLPMSETICTLLRACESLSTLVIGQDGQHHTTSE